MLDELIAELSLPENAKKRLQLLLLLTNTILHPSTICEVNRATPMTLITPETNSTITQPYDTSMVNADLKTETHKSLLDVPDSIRDMIFSFVPQDYITVRTVAKRFHDKRLLSCELLNALEHYYLTSLNETFDEECEPIVYTTVATFHSFISSHSMRVNVVVPRVWEYIREYLVRYADQDDHYQRRGLKLLHLCCAITHYCNTPYQIYIPGGLRDQDHMKLSTAIVHGIRGTTKNYATLEFRSNIHPTILAMYFKSHVWYQVIAKNLQWDDECVKIALHCVSDAANLNYNRITDASLDAIIGCFKKTKFYLTGNLFTTNGKMRLVRAIKQDKLEL